MKKPSLKPIFKFMESSFKPMLLLCLLTIAAALFTIAAAVDGVYLDASFDFDTYRIERELSDIASQISYKTTTTDTADIVEAIERLGTIIILGSEDTSTSIDSISTSIDASFPEPSYEKKMLPPPDGSITAPFHMRIN